MSVFLRYVDVLSRCDVGDHESYYVKRVVYEFADPESKLVSRYPANICSECDADWKADLKGLEARLLELSKKTKESVD